MEPSLLYDSESWNVKWNLFCCIAVDLGVWNGTYSAIWLRILECEWHRILECEWQQILECEWQRILKCEWQWILECDMEPVLLHDSKSWNVNDQIRRTWSQQIHTNRQMLWIPWTARATNNNCLEKINESRTLELKNKRQTYST